MIEELYKKKVIRDFLSLFSESKWKELIFLSIEYGVILLKRNFNVASLSLDDLCTIVDDLKEEENKRIKQNMKKFENDVELVHKRSGSKSALVNKASSNWRRGDEAVFEQVRVDTNTTPFNNNGKRIRQDSKDTRIGKSTLEKLLKVKQDNKTDNIVNYSNIYPDWWGDKNKRQKSIRKTNQVNVIILIIAN